jgi:tetratricopeptide (TPR) repeat protein
VPEDQEVVGLAHKFFDAALDNLKDPIFYFNKGNVYLSNELYEEAHKCFDEAINLDEN